MMNQPRHEVQLPVPYETLRNWADQLHVGLIGESVDDGTERAPVTFGLISIHGGVEITFYRAEEPIHSIVLYGMPDSDDEMIEELIVSGRLYCAEPGCNNVVKFLTPEEETLVGTSPMGTYTVYCRDHAGSSILRRRAEA